MVDLACVVGPKLAVNGSLFGALGKYDIRPVALKVVILRQEKVAAGLRAFIVMAESIQ